MAEAHSEWLHGLQERYRRLLAWAQGRRNPVLFGSVALLAVSLGLSPLLGSEFLPKLDEGNIWLTITLPPSASLERTKEVERTVRAILRSYPEVGNIVTQVGRPDDGTDPKGPNNLEILADLKPRSSWRSSSKEDLVADMSRKIRVLPGVPTNFSQVIQDNVEESLSGTKGEINVKVFGPDLEILESKARQIAAILGGIRGATDTVALGDIATVAVRQGASRVSRQGGGRIALIKSNLRGRDLGSFIDEAQKKVGELVNLPPGYTLAWGGQFENQQRANQRLMVIVPLSALLIFSLLFWAFRSVKKALLVLAMVPFTLIGGIVGLALAGLHLSISAAVGFIAVAGISVQNGVIMVEKIMHEIDQGTDRGKAIIDGAVSRFRPILMTALMAGLGLLPAALSHGIGAETQRPFAVVIVGGIVSATLFTLLLLPLLFPSFARESEVPPA